MSDLNQGHAFNHADDHDAENQEITRNQVTEIEDYLAFRERTAIKVLKKLKGDLSKILGDEFSEAEFKQLADVYRTLPLNDSIQMQVCANLTLCSTMIAECAAYARKSDVFSDYARIGYYNSAAQFMRLHNVNVHQIQRFQYWLCKGDGEYYPTHNLDW